jgi:hypothetical protein
VVVVDPAHFGTDRLEALPVTAMAQAADFRSALGAAPPELLHAVEDEPARAVLLPPYSPLPAEATAELLRRSPIHLLYPQFGIVPFHGRRGELDQLASWLAGDGFALALLLGRGGSGKTRLAAEVCATQESIGWLTGFVSEGANFEALTSAWSPLLLVVDEAQGRLEGSPPSSAASPTSSERALSASCSSLAMQASGGSMPSPTAYPPIPRPTWHLPLPALEYMGSALSWAPWREAPKVGKRPSERPCAPSPRRRSARATGSPNLI